VTGPAGTLFCFRPDIVHRASRMTGERSARFALLANYDAPHGRWTDVPTYNADDIAFLYGPGQCAPPAWQGKLSQVAIDASGHRLRFAFTTSDGYGPVDYEMFNVCSK